MVRVGVSTEGFTELRFIEQVLMPHLCSMKVEITPINKNGNVSVETASKEIVTIFKNFPYVTTLYDFYGFHGKQSGESKSSLEDRLMKAIPQNLRQNFIPYIQMHEFEGLLFSSPCSIASVLNDSNLDSWATNILQQFNNNPEDINDSPNTAPSKRLENQLPAFYYRKSVHSLRIAKLAGLNKLRTACPGFHAWVEQIEQLAPS